MECSFVSLFVECIFTVAGNNLGYIFGKEYFLLIAPLRLDAPISLYVLNLLHRLNVIFGSFLDFSQSSL